MLTKESRAGAIRRILVMLCVALLLAAADARAGEPMPTLAPLRELRSVRIRAAGDLMVHIRQLQIAHQKDDSYDFHPQYELVMRSLADADYTIANLETTIGRYSTWPYSGYPMFNSPESLLDTLRDAGVDFLTLANNHMLDRYFEGMVNTVNRVEEYGFQHGGANRTPQEKDAPVVVEVEGVRLGMLCYTQMTNAMERYCDSAAVQYGVNYLRNADFEAEVRQLKEAGAEAIIAIPHWGEEYFRHPEANTVAIARRMIAAGVDVVLGSHPHMVQPVRYEEAETADGQTRRGLVAYSLGNFISTMSKRYTDTGILLEFTLAEQQDGSFAAVNPGVVPIYCWRTDDMVRALPALKYYDEAPKGMSDSRHRSLRQACSDLRALLGDDVAWLTE